MTPSPSATTAAPGRVSATAPMPAAARPTEPLQALVDRIRSGGDLPAMGKAVREVSQLVAGDRQNLAAVARAVMKDTALSQRLMRLVNSALYRAPSAEPVSTVSRALQMLGMDALRSLALSLVMFERLGQSRTASRLSDEFIRSTLASLVARSVLTPGSRLWEEAGLAAMFHRLGQVLVLCHLPAESALLTERAPDEPRPQNAREIALAVLGVTCEDLGHALGEAWGFPPVLLSGLLRSAVRGPVPPCTSFELTVRVAANLGVEICEMVDEHGPADAAAHQALADRYHAGLGLSGPAMQTALAQAIAHTREIGLAMGVDMARTPFGRRLLGLEPGRSRRPGSAGAGDEPLLAPDPADGGADDEPASAQADETASGASPPDPDPPAPSTGDPAPDAPVLEAVQASAPPPAPDAIPPAPVAQPPAQPEEDPQETARRIGALAETLAELSAMLCQGDPGSAAVRIVIDRLLTVLACRRVVFASWDGTRQHLVGRFGAGDIDADRLRMFRIPADDEGHLLSVAATRGVDLHIAHAASARVSAGLSAWHRRHYAPGSFLMLSVVLDGRTESIVYADKPTPAGFEFDQATTSLMRALRNQLALALAAPGVVV
ncbi:MAG: HDOD domain-containing protein [Betaproteobacteria bacterium]|nr:HDOD domain-containing protein [Betaproteobacteria bacterium]